MAATFNQIPPSVVEQAIAWHLQMNDGQANANKQSELTAWLKQDALHQAAYQRVEKLFQPFDGIDVAAAKNSIDAVLKAENKTAKKKQLTGAAIGLSLLIAVSMSLSMQPVNVLLADNKTAIGEMKTLTLSDHSRITMNTNTALDVDYTQGQRIIRVYQGEVFVEVSKDATRPFLVVTEYGDARALGTQYNVKVNAESMDVSVIESSVEACNAPAFFNVKAFRKDNKYCATLYASQGANVSKQSVSAVTKIDAGIVSGWMSGTAVYNNKPLPQVLTDLQRYSATALVFDATALQHIKVSGVLPITDIPHAISMLEQQFSLKVQQADDEININAQ